ncbi:MAG TPA: sigma-70 family RNA polymerase sigma factor [Mycobacteriales bacterium]|nr:sigma-70 family RNA polymerase sigma factor [Mycobacteriales bacterium]
MNDDVDFDLFMRRTQSRLLARAIMYCGNRQNAEDAVQEAYIEAFRHWSTLESPAAWLETTMRRRLARHARRWWSGRGRFELELPVPAAATVEEEADALAVLRAIGQLPARQRQVLIRICLEGMSYRQVADELGISAGAVGANLSKARAKLATLLELDPAAPRPGDPLVVSPTIDRNRPTGRQDPLVPMLSAAEAWLVRGLESDPGGLDRLRAAVWSAVGERRPG